MHSGWVIAPQSINYILTKLAPPSSIKSSQFLVFIISPSHNWHLKNEYLKSLKIEDSSFLFHWAEDTGDKEYELDWKKWLKKIHVATLISLFRIHS